MCPDCGGLGWYKEAVPYHHPNFGRLFRCECGQHSDRQRQAEQIARQLQTERGRYADATIEEFDWDRDFPAVCPWPQNPQRDPGTGQAMRDPSTGEPLPTLYTPAQQRASFAAARPILERYTARPVGGLYLQGPYGSGKTHMAAAIANAMTAAGYQARYMTIEAMLKHLRAGFEDHSTDARIEALITLDFLVLDDLGAEHLSGWGDARLFDVVNERYNAMRPIILTSNVPILSLNSRIGSRIAGECEIVTLIAYDFRKLQAAERQNRGAA